MNLNPAMGQASGPRDGPHDSEQTGYRRTGSPETGGQGGYGRSGADRAYPSPDARQSGYGEADDAATGLEDSRYPSEEGDDQALSYAPGQTRRPDALGAIIREWPGSEEDFSDLEGDE